jgi:hypothetical protein
VENWKREHPPHKKERKGIERTNWKGGIWGKKQLPHSPYAIFKKEYKNTL